MLCVDLLLSLLCAAPCGAPDDVPGALTELSSPSAVARGQAERWLSVNVELSDFPALTQAARFGDAEVRHRLQRALGRDDRNLGLAARFAALDHGVLRALGEEAIGESLARWNPRLYTGVLHDANPMVRRRLRDELGNLRAEAPSMIVELRLEGPLGGVLDRFARLAGVPIGLVLDADLGEWPLLPRGDVPRVLVGTWDEVAIGIATGYGLSLELFGVPRIEPDDPAPFLHFSRSGFVGYRTGAEVLTDLCRQYAAIDIPGSRRAAARALAASGWPAAMHWLAAEVRQRDDSAAIEGLLLAAARGRVTPSLTTTEAVRVLAHQIDAGFRGENLSGQRVPQSRAYAATYALRAAGPVGGDGADLSAVLLGPWPELDPLGLWWRLVVFEGTRPGSPAVRTAVLGLLASPPGSYPGELLFQALRTLDSLPVPPGEPPPILRDSGGLLAGPGELASGVELGRRLARLGAIPPADPDLLTGGTLEEDAALFEWLLGSGEVRAAARLLLRAGVLEGDWPSLGSASRLEPGPFESSTLAGELLHQRVRAGDAVRARELLAELAGLAPGARAPRERLALLAGLLEEQRQVELLAELESRIEAGQLDDPRALGALVAGPAGERARELLLERVGREPLASVEPYRQGQLVRALLRAMEDLYAEGRDSEARQFRPTGLDAPPGLVPLSLDRLDRLLRGSLARGR